MLPCALLTTTCHVCIDQLVYLLLLPSLAANDHDLLQKELTTSHCSTLNPAYYVSVWMGVLMVKGSKKKFCMLSVMWNRVVESMSYVLHGGFLVRP